MSWLSNLISGRRHPSNPYATDLLNPPDHDKRIPVPKKRGRTPEQQAAAQEVYQATMRERTVHSFRFARARAVGIGSPGYTWRSSRDAQTCPRCRSLEGKRFGWGKPPAGGHPGENGCCPDGWCRCWAEAVLPP